LKKVFFAILNVFKVPRWHTFKKKISLKLHGVAVVVASGWRSEGKGGFESRIPTGPTLTPLATFDPVLPQNAQKNKK